MSVDDHAEFGHRDMPSRRFLARHRKKRYLLVTVFLLVAVAAGAVIGAAGAVLYFKSKRFTHPQPEELAKRITKRMTEVLKITPEESARIEQSVTARMLEVRRIRREMFGRIREEINASIDEVDAVLGPERAAQWERDVKARTGRNRRPPPRDQQKD